MLITGNKQFLYLTFELPISSCIYTVKSTTHHTVGAFSMIVTICDVIWENPSCGVKLIFWVSGLNYFLARIYLNLFWYWYQKLLMFKGYKNKEKHYNYDVYFLYFAVSPLATFDGFSPITSHIGPFCDSVMLFFMTYFSNIDKKRACFQISSRFWVVFVS